MAEPVLVLRSLGGMDAAFCLGPAAPAAGPRVFAFRSPAGARHAADRQETRGSERMRRQSRKLVDRLDLFARDVCERIEFQPDTILLDNRNVGANAALKPL